jgi:iron(III) transport system ATP-binding protein
MSLLEVKDISKSEKGLFTLTGINFNQEPFQKIAIAGETGSGKTTLLKVIAGLAQPESGTVHFKGKRVPGPQEKLLPGHPEIAYLSQHFELRNNYRVEEELECSNIMTSDEAKQLYSICRIDHLLKRKTNELSGGERQRIVLAKLLTTSPSLLLLDEPFSNLDILHKRIIKSVIHDIGKELKTTILLVSHDAPDILSWADKLLIIKGGQIIQEGRPDQLYRQPENEYTAGLLGDYNLINEKESDLFSSIQGFIKGKKILIRPEHFSIRESGSGNFDGMVQHVQFRGHYYLITISILEFEIKVVAINDKYKKGDAVSVSISPENICYL